MRAVLIGLALAAVAAPAPGARAEVLESVAAVVNQDVILRSEVELAAARVLIPLERERGKLPREVVQQVYTDALRSLIDTRLIQSYAERVDLVASSDELDSAIAAIAEDEGLAVDDVYAAAAAQGMEREEYRRELGLELTRMKVISGPIRTRITVSEDEVRDLYDRRFGNQKPGTRARVRHLLIPWPEQATEEDRERLREIASSVRDRAIETGEFARLAAQYSSAASARDGGLTELVESEVAGAIRSHVFSLPPGEITPVIETGYGLNVFQILERYDPSDVAFEDVAPSLRAEVADRKLGPELDKWLDEVRQHEYIEIVDPELQ